MARRDLGAAQRAVAVSGGSSRRREASTLAGKQRGVEKGSMTGGSGQIKNGEREEPRVREEEVWGIPRIRNFRISMMRSSQNCSLNSPASI